MDPVIFKLVSEYQSAFEPLFISVLKYQVNLKEIFKQHCTKELQLSKTQLRTPAHLYQDICACVSSLCIYLATCNVKIPIMCISLTEVAVRL